MLCDSANIDRNDNNNDEDYEDDHYYDWDDIDIEDLDVHLEEVDWEETGDDRFFNFCQGFKARIICTGICVSTKKPLKITHFLKML